MNLFQTIIILIIIILTKDIKKVKSIRENKKASIISWIIVGAMTFSMVTFLSLNYFKTSINLDEFNVIEKVHEEKGIYIYTILEEEKEKYLILKREGIFNKLFLQSKAPVQDMVIPNIDTFKYKHQIEIENSIINHTYKKRWGDGVVSFWIILAVGIYLGSKQEKLSKVDKTIGLLWLIITVGDTIFFII